jgi:hypothetical protein
MLTYWNTFVELVSTPFHDISLVWGIVPLYFALLLNELTSSKANFRTAIQTGFSFLWAGAQWLYAHWATHQAGSLQNLSWVLPVNLFVTLLVLTLGALALFSGLRKRFPKYGSFLGQTRFAIYFMITIFPMQAHKLMWSWQRLGAIILFAVPIWLVLRFGLMPFRRSKKK